MDATAHSYFDRLRTRLFPPERLLIGAHLTLFHQLPPSAFADVRNACAIEARMQAPLPVRATGLYSLGRGVAFRIDSPALAALRDRLADRFAGLLTAQDQTPFRPHVTVMNKAEPRAAADALAALKADFSPFDFRIEGLDLWRYRGGPWEIAGRFRLRGVR